MSFSMGDRVSFSSDDGITYGVIDKLNPTVSNVGKELWCVKSDTHWWMVPVDELTLITAYSIDNVKSSLQRMKDLVK